MTLRRSPRAGARRRLRAAPPPLPQFDLPPAPTKLQQTSPSLTDQVRMLYEDTGVPVAEIARLAGVNQRTLYRYVERGGWRRRYEGRGEAAAAANRGRTRGPRPPQPKGAGGRFIPRQEWGRPQPSGLKALDPQGAARAIEACEHWGTLAAQAMQRAVALQDAERQARIFALVVRAMRDLAAVVDGEPARELRKQARALKPRKRRGYRYKPMLVSSVR